MASGNTRRLGIVGLASFVCIAALVTQSRAAIVGTYVDAKAIMHGVPTNPDGTTYAGPFNTTPSSAFPATYANDFGDGQWDDRGTLGLNSAGALSGPDQNVIEAGPAENVATLTTSVTGLPLNTYDVYVLYWTQGSNGWGVSAKLSTDATFGVYDEGTFATAGTNTGITVGNVVLYEVKVGTVTGTSIDVNIDNANLSVAGRTWYDGVAYKVPEPASFTLLIAAVPFFRRRRNIAR